MCLLQAQHRFARRPQYQDSTIGQVEPSENGSARPKANGPPAADKDTQQDVQVKTTGHRHVTPLKAVTSTPTPIRA
jgi:hypothetical protein